jgi:hypothetical protein
MLTANTELVLRGGARPSVMMTMVVMMMMMMMMIMIMMMMTMMMMMMMIRASRDRPAEPLQEGADNAGVEVIPEDAGGRGEAVGDDTHGERHDHLATTGAAILETIRYTDERGVLLPSLCPL